MSDLVSIDIDSGLALLTLSDGAHRNALSPAMVSAIIDAVDTAEGDPSVRVLVVTGEAPAFCAGADLSALTTVDAVGLQGIYEGFLRLARSPLPTVAAVNGAAVGAGVNLALCCDVRVAARSARFDTRFLRLGLHPGGGATWLLSRVLGPQGAAATAVLGSVLDGETAAAKGLVWSCVDDDRLLEEVRQLCGPATSAPRELVVRIKETLRAAPGVAHHAEAVQLELGPQLWSMSQPAFAEGVAATRRRMSGRD